MRVAIATALLCAIAAVVDAKCPKKDKDNKGWKKGKTVTYQIDTTTIDRSHPLRGAAQRAIDSWNKANANVNNSSVAFVPAPDPDRAMLIIAAGPTQRDAPGTTQVTAREADGSALGANITINLPNRFQFVRGARGYESWLEKAVAHELGHTMGLADADEPITLGQTVMNRYAEECQNDICYPDLINDCNAGVFPCAPSTCDNEELAVIYSSPFAGGGADEDDPRFRPRPAGMPSDYDDPNDPFGGSRRCRPCMVPARICTRILETGQTNCFHVMRWGWCCWGTTHAILQGYKCEDDGWVSINRSCNADLCCLHPDDLPEETLWPGTSSSTQTCGDMGWFFADQVDVCLTSYGSCERKQMCGDGYCKDWPFYCWKGVTQPAPTPTPTPAPLPGKTCAEMGWYAADKQSECTAAQGSCEKKQECGAGLQCMPWPHYCWRPTNGNTLPIGGGGGGDNGGGGGGGDTGYNTCSSQGFYHGEDYDSCVHDHSACEKKQQCGDKDCEPPGYCWRPS